VSYVRGPIDEIVGLVLNSRPSSAPDRAFDDELAADTEALARAEGQSIKETVKQALKEAVDRRRRDPKFTARVKQIIEHDRELLERLAR
jgi:hypothetical protein